VTLLKTTPIPFQFLPQYFKHLFKMLAANDDKGYELGKILSREKDSHTYHATVKDQPDGQQYRVRRIFSAAADRVKADRASTIIEKLKKLSHKNLLPIVDSYILNNEDTGSRDLCIVYTETPGNTMAHKVGENSFEPDLTGGMPALDLSGVTDLFFGVLSGLEYLHGNSTAHMDLSPDSVLLLPDKGGIVLANYGLADVIAVHSLEFIAPEVHKREDLLPNMLDKVDVWAVGD
jgi:serine/threonine protein kinase